jgi:hypothetical protein
LHLGDAGIEAFDESVMPFGFGDPAPGFGVGAAGSFSSRSKVLLETGASSRAMICCSVSLGVRGAMVSGRMRLCGSPSPTSCR